jgi:hypothetical protein
MLAKASYISSVEKHDFQKINPLSLFMGITIIVFMLYIEAILTFFVGN